jgi:hypothetical protein
MEVGNVCVEAEEREREMLLNAVNANARDDIIRVDVQE